MARVVVPKEKDDDDVACLGDSGGIASMGL